MNRTKLLCFNRILINENGNYTLNNVLLRTFAFKSDLKIKWVRPEKIPCHKPEKSGDLEGIPKIDKRQLILDFNNSKELKTADDNVRKLFMLEFAPRKYTNRYIIHKIVDKVRRHEFDVGSAEVKIAKWTGIIRALQEVLEEFPRNKKLKVNLKELIDQRKKHLKYLRRWDYKKFEWLLENLNIIYKPTPTNIHPVTRKDSLRKLTQIYCDDIKEKRLDAYKLKLESEQPAFLEEKIRALQFIRDEQMECGIEVTVTQKEIDDVKEQLKQLNNLSRKNND
ncbi:28S ribosomal protein S15, mitochondrial [Anoplophora glabripennis]|nr:28S ribosomal protein S15, mitochondrial [Anoplophora glabripennis]